MRGWFQRDPQREGAGRSAARVCGEGWWSEETGNAIYPHWTILFTLRDVILVDVSDILNFFFGRGGGRGIRGAGGRWGIGLSLKSPGGGSPGRERPKGREGVGSELGNWGWGG